MIRLTHKFTVTVFAGLMAALLAYATGVDTPDFALSGGDELIPLYEDTVLVFRQSGTLHVTGSGYVEILAVGGGGGGGANGTSYGGAGGGAGGVVHLTDQFVTGGNYSVVVGSGGAVGSAGETTTVSGSGVAINAYGGGEGAAGGSSSKGGNGASGGGSSIASGGSALVGGEAIYSSALNRGNDGGGASNPFGGGGGGGAGAVGETTGSSTPGRGGEGYCCTIVGTNVWYGGGGAGFRNKFDVSGGCGGGGSCVKATDGQSSTSGAGVDGHGGGGCGGAAGGKGIVIVRYHKISYKTAFTGATGGTRTRRQGSFIHTFTEDGTFMMPVDGLVEVLLVGGGGGGGVNDSSGNGWQGGGGGGAGGVVHVTNMVLRAGSYAVVIGDGGEIGVNGENTAAFGKLAYGGGAGARYDGRGTSQVSEEGPYGRIGLSGASGGGSTHVANVYSGLAVAGGSAIYGEEGNLGHDGGACTHQYGASGGGGAGEAGGNNNGGVPGVGGRGYSCDISGLMTYYAGGGAGFRRGQRVAGGEGGGGACNDTEAGPGVDGLGGGGCGGAKGGSGVVIIRYKVSPMFIVSFR